jgi:hypothetical protein
MKQSEPDDLQECTVCRIVKNKREVAYRRISKEGADESIWFCLNCDVEGLKCSQEVASVIKATFGNDFGWDEFVSEWINELDPIKD